MDSFYPVVGLSVALPLIGYHDSVYFSAQWHRILAKAERFVIIREQTQIWCSRTIQPRYRRNYYAGAQMYMAFSSAVDAQQANAVA